MKKLAILTALFFALPASADSGERIQAKLTGYQEVPAVSSVARGEFKGKISHDEGMIEYELTYDGLQGAVTQSHIHIAQRGVNGSIVIWLCGTPALPGPAGTQTCPASGTIFGTITAANVVAGAATQQLAAGELAEVIAAMRARAAYVNVHTIPSPGGEVRGQIRASKRDD